MPYRDMDSSDDTKSFFKHVFNFDDDTKGEILNILQYSLIAIIPVIILNKTMQKYVPEADDKKNSLEITAEVVIQIIVMFIGLLSLLFIKQTWTFYAVAVFTGFTQSAAMVGSTLVARLYGLKAHATIFSMPNFAITIGAAVGPYLFGYIHDLTNSYHQAFLISMLIAGLGIISSLVLLLDKSK